MTTKRQSVNPRTFEVFNGAVVDNIMFLDPRETEAPSMEGLANTSVANFTISFKDGRSIRIESPDRLKRMIVKDSVITRENIDYTLINHTILEIRAYDQFVYIDLLRPDWNDATNTLPPIRRVLFEKIYKHTLDAWESVPNRRCGELVLPEFHMKKVDYIHISGSHGDVVIVRCGNQEFYIDPECDGPGFDLKKGGKD